MSEQVKKCRSVAVQHPVGNPRIWVDNVKEESGRWLTPTEVLMAQAFPVHPQLHKNWKVCPFNFPRELRRPRAVCAQSGNSMSILCTYIIALHSAVCFREANRADRRWVLNLAFCFYVSSNTVYQWFDGQFIPHLPQVPFTQVKIERNHFLQVYRLCTF